MIGLNIVMSPQKSCDEWFMASASVNDWTPTIWITFIAGQLFTYSQCNMRLYEFTQCDCKCSYWTFLSNWYKRLPKSLEEINSRRRISPWLKQQKFAFYSKLFIFLQPIAFVGCVGGFRRTSDIRLCLALPATSCCFQHFTRCLQSF